MRLPEYYVNLVTGGIFYERNFTSSRERTVRSMQMRVSSICSDLRRGCIIQVRPYPFDKRLHLILLSHFPSSPYFADGCTVSNCKAVPTRLFLPSNKTNKEKFNFKPS